MEEIDHTEFAFFCWLDQYCAGAVAEKDAGGTVGVVEDRGHGVGADDENLGVRAGFDELHACLQCVDEAGAGG